jgi:hypothetical protein
VKPGVRPDYRGRKNVLVISPANRDKASVITAEYQVPQGAAPKMAIDTLSDDGDDFRIKVLVNDEIAAEQVVDSKGEWKPVVVDLAEYAGRIVPVRIEISMHVGPHGAAYLGAIDLQ